MNKLNDVRARPRRRRIAPSYPRALGIGVVALVAACGGNVDMEGEDSGGTTVTIGQGGGWGGGPAGVAAAGFGQGANGAGGAGGEAGAGAEAGAGGEAGGAGGAAGHGWGGGLTGDAPEPFGGGAP